MTTAEKVEDWGAWCNKRSATLWGLKDGWLFSREVRLGISFLSAGYAAIKVHDPESAVLFFARNVMVDSADWATAIAGCLGFVVSYLFGPEFVYWSVNGIGFVLLIYFIFFISIYIHILCPLWTAAVKNAFSD